MFIKQILLYILSLKSIYSFIDLSFNTNEKEIDAEVQIKLIFIQLKDIKQKQYKNKEEEDYRFQIFKQNIKEFLGTLEGIYDKYKIILVEIDNNIEKRLVIKGDNPCQYKMDMNKFIDMSKEEFQAQYLLPSQFFDTKIYKPKSVYKDDEIDNKKLNEILNDKNFNVFHEKLKFKETGKYSQNISEQQKKLINSLPDFNQPNQKPEIIDERIIDIECEIFQNELQTQESQGRRLQQSFYSPTYYSTIPSTTNTYYNSTNNYFTQPTTRTTNYYRQPRTQNSNNYFQNYYNTSTYNNPFQRHTQQMTRKNVTLENVTIPTYINWRSKKNFTPVKDQLDCNSCYAFGAISAIEAHNSLKYNNYQTFSEQEILDCSSRNLACTGGQPFLVFDYIINQGVSLQRDYPYQSRKLQCRKQFTNQRFKNLRGYYFIPNGILNLLKAVNSGPVVVVSYASDSLKYQYNGIFDGRDCNPYQQPNHASLLYGYDLNAPVPYLMFKNNWGTFWGQAGYYKVAIGPLTNQNKGHCLIAQTPYNVMPVINQFNKQIKTMNQEIRKDKCEQYLRDHRVKELFEDLCTAIAFKRPENIEQFLLQELQQRQQKNCMSLPLFSENEIENIFQLYNLKGGKFLDRQKAKEALQCMANSDVEINSINDNQEIPDLVDLEMFKHLAQEVLGIQINN